MKAIPNLFPSFPRADRQRGFSLVELMVAMVIGLFVVASVGMLFVSSKRTYLTQDANSRLQESARFIVDYLGRQVRMAGYSNMQFDLPTQLATNLYATPKIFGFSGTPITGTNSGVQDSITVSYDAATDCLGQSVSGTPVVNQYQINASTKKLECVGNTGTAGVILDDVEAMDVTYGRPVGSNITYQDASATGATGMTIATSVRLCLLLRALADSDKRGTEASQIYLDCTGTSQTGTDGYLRRAITMTFDLRNRLP